MSCGVWRQSQYRQPYTAWQSGWLQPVSHHVVSSAMQQSSASEKAFAAHITRRITRPKLEPPDLGMCTKCAVIQRRCGSRTRMTARGSLGHAASSSPLSSATGRWHTCAESSRPSPW